MRWAVLGPFHPRCQDASIRQGSEVGPPAPKAHLCSAMPPARACLSCIENEILAKFRFFFFPLFLKFARKLAKEANTEV